MVGASDEEIHGMTDWIVENLGVDVPLHFTVFHPDFKMRNHPPTPPETLTRAREIAISKGIRYVYTGNVHDKSGEGTYCHNCGHVLIERDWFVLGEYHLKENKCDNCSTICAGHFGERPGNWGPKRVPFNIREMAIEDEPTAKMRSFTFFFFNDRDSPCERI